MFAKLCLSFGGLAGSCGVVLGALSAHALKHRVDASALATLDTSSKYFLVHGLLLILLALIERIWPQTWAVRISDVLIMTGLVFFCGGLSLSVLTGNKVLAMLAPAGGSALILGWLTLTVFALAKS